MVLHFYWFSRKKIPSYIFIQYYFSINFQENFPPTLLFGTKAATNYHVRNGRAQNLLLSSPLCSAIDWFIIWINQWRYIKEKKVINSAHGHYGRDSLSVLYFFINFQEKFAPTLLLRPTVIFGTLEYKIIGKYCALDIYILCTYSLKKIYKL